MVDGFSLLGTGTRQGIFQIIETFSWLRLKMKTCRGAVKSHSCSAQAFTALGLIPSVPAALFRFSLSSCFYTWLLETDKYEGGSRDLRVSRCEGRCPWGCVKIYDWGRRWYHRCVIGRTSLQGGYEFCVAGEKGGSNWVLIWIEPVGIHVHLIGSVQTSISLILVQFKACDLLHPWSYISPVLLLLAFYLLICTRPQKIPVYLPEGFLFHVQQPFQVTGEPGFVMG